MCPVCAAKITEGRKQDIDTVLTAHQAVGGNAYMATLTIPHHRFHKCKELRDAVAQAWRKVKSGKPWQKARDRHNYIGDIRALEVTHGKNGWHPHLHVLVMFEPGTSVPRMEKFGQWLFEAWKSAIENLGFGTCSEGAYRFDKASELSGAADYVGKWGASLELSKAHVKHAKNGGRTPWQILADFAENGMVWDKQLFTEYAKAFKGSRQLTWSQKFTRLDGTKEPSIRDRYLLEPELSDEELAKEDQAPETHKASFDRALFTTACRKGLTAHLLTAHETNGIEGILDLLSQHEIPWALSEAPGLQSGTSVPYISLREAPGNYPPIPYRGSTPIGVPPDPNDNGKPNDNVIDNEVRNVKRNVTELSGSDVRNVNVTEMGSPSLRIDTKGDMPREPIGEQFLQFAKD